MLSGPMTIGVFVKDLALSQKFYEERFGWKQSPLTFPDGVIFDTKPVPVILKTIESADDDYEGAQVGWGIRVMVQTESSLEFFELRQACERDGVPIGKIFQSALGPTFTVTDPDGNRINVFDGS